MEDHNRRSSTGMSLLCISISRYFYSISVHPLKQWARWAPQSISLWLWLNLWNMQTYHHRWSTVCLTKTAFNANSHVVKQVLRESGSRSPNCLHRTGKAILMGRMAPKHKYGSYRSLPACSVKHTLLYHLYAMHHHILSFPGDEDTGPEPLDLADGVKECEEDRAKRIMDDEADLMKEKCHRVWVRVGGRERERWFWRIGFPKKCLPFSNVPELLQWWKWIIIICIYRLRNS